MVHGFPGMHNDYHEIHMKGKRGIIAPCYKCNHHETSETDTHIGDI
jgi:hypothetical protein